MCKGHNLTKSKDRLTHTRVQVGLGPTTRHALSLRTPAALDFLEPLLLPYKAPPLPTTGVSSCGIVRSVEAGHTP